MQMTPHYYRAGAADQSKTFEARKTLVQYLLCTKYEWLKAKSIFNVHSLLPARAQVVRVRARMFGFGMKI